MDASVPVQRALAIAGERVAGGIGTHETALASPDVVDLGGRCVLPGFTDAHVHFPSWALALRQVRLEGTTSLDEALERVRSAEAPGGVLRGFGWRDAEWATPPTKEALDAVTGRRSRRALRPRLPLALAQLGRARTRRRRPRGPRRRGRAGRQRRADGHPPRGGGLAASGTVISLFPTTSTSTRCARGCAWPPPAA